MDAPNELVMLLLTAHLERMKAMVKQSVRDRRDALPSLVADKDATSEEPSR